MHGWRRFFGRGRADEPQSTPREARDEQLSAYLDDALTPAERAEIDAALAGDDELQVQLDGLRAVRAALRSLDEVRAPRSFALTAPPPGATPARRRGMPRLELVTRLATVTAAALFVVALAIPGGGSSETIANGSPGVASFSAAPATTAASAAPAEGTPSALHAAPQAAPTAAPQAPTAALAAPRAAPAAETPTAATASPESRAAIAPYAAPTATDAGASAAAAAPAGTPSAKTGAAVAPETPTELAPPPGVATPATPEGGTHRLITVGLGALTVLLAALSAGEWIVRRGHSG